MRKIALSVLLLVAFSSLALAGQKKVTVSGQPGPPSMPLFIAMEKNWFAEEGLDVDTLVYISGPPQMEAAPSEAWLVGCAGTPATITGVLGFDNVMLGFSVWDHPAHQLLARADSPIVKRGKGHFPKTPEIYGTTDDYRKIKILGTRGTLGHLQLLATLAAVGLTENDVEIVHMEIPAAYQAFKAGEGDAVVLWSTFSKMGQDEGWVAVSSAEWAGLPVPSVVSAIEAGYKKDPESIQKVMNVWVRAMIWYQENKKEAAEIYYRMCQNEGIAATPELCQYVVDTHDIPSLEEMEAWLTTDGFQKVLDRVLKFYVQTGNYTEAERAKVIAAFDLSFLKKAIDNYKVKYKK